MTTYWGEKISSNVLAFSFVDVE